MATIIYKKYFKKDSSQQKPPSQAPSCNHQRSTSDGSEIPLTELHAGQEKNAPREIDKNFRSDGGASCEVCQYEKKALKKYRWKLIIGLFLPFLVQSLDSTIIAGALPYIASDFRKSSSIKRHMLSIKLTSDRPTLPTKLDYLSIQTHFRDIHPILGPICRRLRSLYCHSNRSPCYVARKHSLFSSASDFIHNAARG
jgi:hypothetical protein